ncbi:hypothetical protein HYN69_09930 [Gemmobacter aquarius]|uniref:Uncharacterized protein n=1 Tax=Paragemmobacter aquarius TaxID=2169400 RepID=A0A2S0ULV6_9RHOB|nr:hypothetical protein HYN69_09930 [Gemmobacter aquarius]
MGWVATMIGTRFDGNITSRPEVSPHDGASQLAGSAGRCGQNSAYRRSLDRVAGSPLFPLLLSANILGGGAVRALGADSPRFGRQHARRGLYVWL